MKNIKYLVVLFIFMIIPLDVNALELNCEKDNVNYDETFFCYLTGNVGVEFKELSGNITSTNNSVKCNLNNIASGFKPNETDKNFSYSGKPQDANFISISCKLVDKLPEAARFQVKIEDFKYKYTSSSYASGENETISTDYITANNYVQEIVNNDDLPRDTSDPTSLLKALYDENLNMIFSKFITTYNQEVLYEVDHLDLKIITDDESATYKIVGNDVENNQSLNVGQNRIDIIVTSPNTHVTAYTIYVKRLARGEQIYYSDKDATLSSLIVPGHTISFDKDIYDYKVHIPSNVSSLKVNAIPTIEDAKVSISATDNLRNGSIIKVSVISKDKTTTLEYNIHITKEAEKKNKTPIIIGTISIFTIIILIVIFIKTSQTKKGDTKKDIIKEENLSTENLTVNNTQNVIDLSNSNVVSVESNEVVNSNLNQITNNTPTLDLTNAEVINNQAVTPVSPVENVISTPNNQQIQNVNSQNVVNTNNQIDNSQNSNNTDNNSGLPPIVM